MSNFSLNIKLRIISGIILISVFSLSVLWSEKLFFLVVLSLAYGMLNEWFNITNQSKFDLIVGMILISFALISLLYVRGDNKWLLYFYFITVWSMDSFAMIGGKTFQGLKLMPVISPNKTWSGLISGMVAVGIIIFTANYLFAIKSIENIFYNKINMTLFFVTLGFVAQISDLLVSYYKRKYKIKDSGTVIPGHGGVLDRFDSILLTAPILYLKVGHFYVL